MGDMLSHVRHLVIFNPALLEFRKSAGCGLPIEATAILWSAPFFAETKFQNGEGGWKVYSQRQPNALVEDGEKCLQP